MRRLAIITALVATVVLVAIPALGRVKKPRVRYQDTRRERASAVYAGMSKAACLKALSDRKIGFRSVATARGVLAPVRLTGDVGGVVFRTDAPAGERAVSSAEVLDCRLVLALHDWSKVLAAHGFDEVRFGSAWRPPKGTGPLAKPATRHGAALAIDVKRLGKKLARGDTAKRWLSVEADFRGRIGAAVCVDGARGGAGGALPAAAKELRAVVCEARDRGLFTSILTPSYDRAHRDHFHLELRPKVTWALFL